jgi:hypothetical protein
MIHIIILPTNKILPLKKRSKNLKIKQLDIHKQNLMMKVIKNIQIKKIKD